MSKYHMLSLSGGKDSTALAIYIMENMPELHEKIEYIFYDTELDLPETYTYLNKVKVFVGKDIIRVKPKKILSTFFIQQAFCPLRIEILYNLVQSQALVGIHSQ